MSKKVSQKAGVPPKVSMGLASRPSLFMSISRKLMPSCFFVLCPVRTRQKIQSAY